MCAFVPTSYITYSPEGLVPVYFLFNVTALGALIGLFPINQLIKGQNAVMFYSW